MMKVYLVTKGSYSDYHIVAAFSTRELAELGVKAFADRYESPEVEEYTLDAEPVQAYVDMMNTGLRSYWVTMARDGETLDINDYEELRDSALANQTDLILSRDGDYFNARRGGRLPIGTRYLRTFMWARDEQHAVKIANERRVQLIATEQWE